MSVFGSNELDTSSGAATEIEEAASKPRGWIRKIVPWMLGIGVLTYLFTQVPLADAWEATRSADIALLLTASSAAVACWFWLESGAFSYLFTRFHVPFTWKEARSLRGSTYVLTPINWNLGTAAIILYLRRSKGISALEATSTMLFYGTIDGLVMASLTFVGLAMMPASPALEQFQRLAAGAAVAQLGFMTILMADAPAWGWLEKIRSISLLRSYRAAGWREVFTLVGIRTLYFSIFALYFWAGARAFHVELPLAVSTATLAVILMAQAIPITPAGLGTLQAAMLYFWRPYGAEAGVLAFALAFPVCVTVARMLLGLVYLRDIRKRLSQTS